MYVKGQDPSRNFVHSCNYSINLMIDRVNRLLGEGTYGKVVECIDQRRDRSVAVKIIRSIRKYREAARIEIRVLDHLNHYDPHGQK